MARDGRNATQAYRVRVGGTWYWVDPTVSAIEPGDTVVIYPADGDATLALLQSAFAPGREAVFATLEGERFTLPAANIAALHLAAVDDEQGPVDGNR
jgi:hypothetical protein